MIDLDFGFYVEVSPDLYVQVFAPPHFKGDSHGGLIGTGEITCRGENVRWFWAPDWYPCVDIEGLTNAIVDATMHDAR